ncbi:MAG: TlyA family RNA methyltransferase [Erysipelotrichaceae bacterium]|nr:TlyA family RNA methyltransferase [Erysipelotrichaceae bacterium]
MKLSLYLVEKGYYPTRSQAKNALSAGNIRVNGRIIKKDGYEVSDSDEITVEMPENRYVSRGGYKLEAALRHFEIPLEGLICLDIGASTGGFTDCCLQNGAKRVYAYDVGHLQLHPSLLNDQRVVSREGINARYLSRVDFEEEIDFICMDVSFISCTKILPAISNILKEKGSCVILFKPQFEVGNANLNKKGIVNNESAVREKLTEFRQIASELSLKIKGEMVSPIKGQDGNTEYLLHLEKHER